MSVLLAAAKIWRQEYLMLGLSEVLVLSDD